MAKKNHVNGDTSQETVDTNAADEMGDEFQTIETDRFMYKVDACGNKALVGWLIDKIEMTPIKGRSWDAFVVRTTEPSLACDREGQVIETVPGQEVLIPATHQLAQFMSRAAAHPSLAFKVYIKPKGKIQIGGGQSMQTYKLGVNPKGRTLQQLGIQMLRDVPQHKALPTSTTDSSSPPDTVPFE